MRFFQIVLASTAAKLATAGFATYKEIRSGFDNSEKIKYSPLDRSETLFLYIQITAGVDDSDVIADFKTLARNYGDEGVKAIPRVRYGTLDGEFTSEPEDLELILDDVDRWAGVFEEVAGDLIDIPVIQAGFLGEWGEWHVSQPNSCLTTHLTNSSHSPVPSVPAKESTRPMRTSRPRKP